MTPTIPYYDYMTARGYAYVGIDRPFHMFKKDESVIGICVPCGMMVINGQRVRAFGGKQLEILNKYFNETEKEKKETSV